VVTSNISTFWAALRKAGITDPIEGYGTLLREH
jgi:maleate cis-trans isomerase